MLYGEILTDEEMNQIATKDSYTRHTEYLTKILQNHYKELTMEQFLLAEIAYGLFKLKQEKLW